MPTPPNLQPTLQFLDELSRNNNKAWFELHRPEYEKVRGAFEALINDLIDEFRGEDNLQNLNARNCIARIYRDIRFSRDKSPYKTNLAAVIGPGGWKSDLFGYYLHLEPQDRSMAAGGVYDPSPEQLERFRQSIDKHYSRFREVASAPAFVDTFGGLQGERLKTAPKGYDKNHPEIELLQLKQITVIHRFTDQEVLSSDFEARLAKAFRAMRPFLNYLSEIGL